MDAGTTNRGYRTGFTLIELLIGLTIAGFIVLLSAEGLRSYRESTVLSTASRVARHHLGLARTMAVARRQTLRVRLSPSADLLLLDPADGVVSTSPLGAGSSFSPDSIRLRPSTLRFNARGQAAPGSVYLYRGDRGVRLVSNFLGRVRVERFSLP